MSSTTPTSPSRTLALWVPDWPVIVALALAHLPPHTPAITVSGTRITAASAFARAAGVRTTMALRHAQETLPTLTCLPTPPTDILAREHERIAQVLDSFLAHLTVLRPGLTLAPIDGALRHYPDPPTFLAAVTDAITDTTGIDPWAGIANGTLPAILAARRGRILTPDESLPFIQTHPLHTLRYTTTAPTPDPELTDLLALWAKLGLHTYADLASLPPTDIATRFGARGMWAYHIAIGQEEPLVSQDRNEPDITVSSTFDEPLHRADTAAFYAKQLASQLREQLVKQGLSAYELRVSARTNERILTRTWRADPTMVGALSEHAITQRVRWQCDGWLSASAICPHTPKVGPLDMVELTAVRVIPAGHHHPTLWGADNTDNDHTRRLVERLSSLVGPDGVVVPRITGGRTPADRVTYVPWDQEVTTTHGGAPHTHVSALAGVEELPWPGRLPAPAPSVTGEPVKVWVRDPAGREVRVDDLGALVSPPYRWCTAGVPLPGTEHVSGGVGDHTVTQWSGPWVLSPAWWAMSSSFDSPGESQAYLQLMSDSHPPIMVVLRGRTWWWEGTYE